MSMSNAESHAFERLVQLTTSITNSARRITDSITVLATRHAALEARVEKLESEQEKVRAVAPSLFSADWPEDWTK